MRFAVEIENRLRAKWPVSDTKNEFKTQKQRRKIKYNIAESKQNKKKTKRRKQTTIR